MVHHRSNSSCLSWDRRVVSLLLLAGLLAPAFSARAQVEQTPAVETAIAAGAADGDMLWGDIDNDGDQDLLVTGRASVAAGEVMTTRLLRNTGGTLVPEGSAGLPNLESSSLALGDFDNDGDLDVLITGQNGVNLLGETGLAGVYRNDGSGAFTLAKALTGVYRGSAAWGDYDLDGDLDILLTGYQNGGSGFGAIYRNDAGVFTEDTRVDMPVPAVGDSSVAWGDYDADRDLDYVILGKTCEDCLLPVRIAQVMRNNGSGYFWAVNLTENGLWNGAAAWIDVEQDGDLDLILTGNNGPDISNRDPLTHLYLYDPVGGLVLSNASNLPGIWQSTLSVGDYDNDGDPDLLLNGMTAAGHITRIYANTAGVFTDVNAGLKSAAGASVAWGHLDGDANLEGNANLDVSVSGVENAQFISSTYLYTFLPLAANTAPSTPALLSACWDGDKTILLDWDYAGDAQTPASGLSYSVRVGTAPGSGSVSYPPADLASGYRRVPLPGSSAVGSTMLMISLPPGSYTWSVQAVDTAYTGSPFSGEGAFIVGTPIAFDDSAWAASGETNRIDVLANDSDGYGPLSILNVQDPPHGWATVIDGQISYTPDPGWAGEETVEYYALSPSTGYCSRGLLTVKTPGVYLDPSWVREGQPVGTGVGILKTTSPNAGETFTYLLYEGEGDTDNGSFTIHEDKLLTAEVFNSAEKDSYSVRIKAIGSLGTHFYQSMLISVWNADLNPPEDIGISNSSVQENISVDSTVGVFSCIDPDPRDWCYFALVDGEGSADNASFSINWLDLRSRATFDYETKSSYSIRVRATDSTGRWVEKIFTITVINLSDADPTDIALSRADIDERQPANTTIGAFSTIDPDPADSFRYQLVKGEGSSGNAAFSLTTGGALRSSTVFNAAKQDRYSIRVRSTDQTDRSVEKIFTITIHAVPPNLIYLPLVSRAGD